MRSIDLVMSQTGTILSKAIKGVTGDKYNHISISFNKNLEPMYSFGRKYPNIPWIGTLVEEHIDSGTFKKFGGTTCKVIEIPVEDYVYDAALYYVQSMMDKQKSGLIEYEYNVLGLIYGLFGKKRQSENHYYCSEFVREVLSVAGHKCSDIPYYVPHPVDFENLGGEVIYEGRLCDYPYKIINNVKRYVA